MSSLIDTYGMPPISLLRAHDGATRYISHVAGKTLTKSQIKAIHAAGRVVVANFEDSATNAKGGRAQGVTDGAFAAAQMKALGFPKGCACFASVDYEVHSGAALTTATDYARGFTAQMHAAGYLAGIYGCYDLIRHLLDGKVVDFGWQCAAWSYGSLDARAVLYQDTYTASYDVNQIRHANYGGWTPTGAQKAPAASEPDLLEELMALPGAPKTWAEACEDIAAAVVNHDITSGVNRKKKFPLYRYLWNAEAVYHLLTKKDAK